MISGHGGNIFELARRLGCSPADIVDMSSNVNPIGPPPGLIEQLAQNLDTITALPEASAGAIVRAFAEHHGIDPGCVLAANGTTQFIYTLPYALNPRQVLILGPTYADYADACTMHRVPHTYLMAAESGQFRPDPAALAGALPDAGMVFVCNPNNPTGVLIEGARLRTLCRSHPDVTFVLDESYLPFVPDGEKQSLIDCGLTNVIILNSMSKIFRIPGLRIGFLVAAGERFKRLAQFAQPWCVNSLAQMAVDYLMTRAPIDDFVHDTQQLISTESRWFRECFGAVPQVRFFDSCTSFILGRLCTGQAAEALCAHLAEHRILIRDCANFCGLTAEFFRISLKTRAKNQMLVERLLAFFGSHLSS